MAQLANTSDASDKNKPAQGQGGEQTPRAEKARAEKKRPKKDREDRKAKSSEHDAQATPTKRPPWSPLVLAIAGLVFTAGFSSLWTGALAAFNRRRLGNSRRAWLPLLLGVAGLLGAVASYSLVREAPWWTPPYIRIWMIAKYNLYGSLLWWAGPAVEAVAWAAIVLFDLRPQRQLYNKLRSAGGRRASIAVPILIGFIVAFIAVNVGAYGQKHARARLAESTYQQGLERLADGGYGAALQAFAQAAELAPKNADIALHQARLLARLGKPQDGLKAYDKVLALRPDDVVARLERARLLVALHKYEDAEGDCTFLLKTQPDQIPARFMRAVARFEQQKYEKSLEDMDQALKIAPTDPLMHAYRGKIDLKLKHSKAAIEDFTKAMQGQPGDALYYFDRALAHLQLDDKPAAIDDFTEAIERNPNDITSLLARANAYMALGKTQQAIEDCDAALRLVSRFSSEPVEQRSELAGVYSLRARCHIRQGDFADGLKDAQRSLVLDENWADGYFCRGLIALAHKEYDEAKRQFDRAIELSSPDSRVQARALYYRGRAYETQGDAKAAQRDTQEALKVDPSVVETPSLPDEAPSSSAPNSSAPKTEASEGTNRSTPRGSAGPIEAPPM